VAYSIGDNQLVSIVFAMKNIKKVKAFFLSKDLKDKMTEAGVEGAPTVFFYSVVQIY
jgi:hypothetical protein